MKSAYEAALERLEEKGIDRPREDALSDADRARMAEIRSRAEAQLAELEIMYRQRLERSTDFAQRQQDEEEYRRDRARIESSRDSKLEEIRRPG